MSGMLGFYDLPTQIAVDNDPSSPSYGDLYVPEIDQEGEKYNIQKYGPNGEHLATMESLYPTGVGVDPANGNVYVTSHYGYLLIYTPSGTLTTYANVGETSPEPEGVVVDSAGDAFVVNGGGQSARKGTTEVYHPEGEGFVSGNHLRQLDPEPSYGIALDLSTEHIYVDEGNQVSEFETSGHQVGSASGAGLLTSETSHHSTSLAANAEKLYVSNPSEEDVFTFGPSALPSDPRTDNPLVIDSVNSPDTRHTGDFEVTPSGNDAVFTSTLPETGYDNGLVHREVFRYDTVSGLDCPSCSPTAEQATGEASLPPNGLGLSNDGRVFFNTTEGLVDRDLNEQEDAYQWEPKGYRYEYKEREESRFLTCETENGCVQLISTGASSFASKLFGISSDGVDAYFFTRDKLTEEDENGNAVKIYDARSLGGFPFVPPVAQCKASDECHGPGTPTPSPPQIASVAPTPGGNSLPLKCRARFVKHHGICVKHPHHMHKHRHGARHHG